MSRNTGRWVRLVLSLLISGMIGCGGVVLGAINETGALSKGTLTVAFLTGLMAALKDAQSYLSSPPGTPSQREDVI